MPSFSQPTKPLKEVTMVYLLAPPVALAMCAGMALA